MARPKKDIESLKSIHISFRTTVDNYLIVAHNAESCGLSIADYIRMRITCKPLPRFKVSPYERKVYVELSRLGNNINQLTKKAHLGQNQPDKLKIQLVDLQKLLHEVKQAVVK
ncbi:plasmid mobilization relaxosome protein MobC [Pricia sp. S334]|uniref:Plasmid mobilization relaxosome protein MobC n=1 Tax=Pricia mediterranea TaxID=3076079 RepID=A0ABU3L4S2_9FLAO|nr:plasmid mobilization relaxosome protein MobC [Pricia sp. S334]MDT7828331.1 plasmid mobilization relaxosome protein MobC [Pricia sp. S334]